MEGAENIVCIILAGGAGKRMASKDLHKVCFPMLGKPAIVRAIDTYKKAGIKRFVVVVGQMAGQVMQTVAASHPDVTFVYQNKPRGTGHAALVAAEALAAQNYHGAAMIVMGDKVAQCRIVRQLIDKTRSSRADTVMTTLPKQEVPTAGRIVRDPDGTILGIVEVADIRHAGKKKTKVRIAGRRLTARQVEQRSSTANVSMYSFRFDALCDALHRLESDNAQGELYLTDTIEYLVTHGGVDTLDLTDPTDLMAYNTPAELLTIEQILAERLRPRVTVRARKKLAPAVFKTASAWLKILQKDPAHCTKVFKKLYGADESLIDDRRRKMINLAGAFAKRFGPKRKMIICRAPGRVNLLGRHVDHRGGYVNVMAISREVLLAASPREDDLVDLHNLDAGLFPRRSFNISGLLEEASWADWLDFVASSTVRNMLDAAPGDWSHYARAPLLRLQHECPDVRLMGMDCMVTGDIPMGAGLSSSSAMVVAFAEAAATINGLNITTPDFVDLCGEGEWFVGSRGGSADHAAIRTSKRGYISRIGFHPFRMEGEIRFPSNLQVVIAYSGTQAVKSAEARHVYNQRVACYEIAQMLLRRNWPAAAGVEHLRDLTPSRLKVQDAEVYRGLMRLPAKPSRKQIREMLGDDGKDALDRLFATHSYQGGYDLRGTALFGISECIRSEGFAEALERRDLEAIGNAMTTSHDGDRLVRFDGQLRRHRFSYRTDDKVLKALADANTPLAEQPGRYACSTEAIDQLVDISMATDGVIGAQLAGAGLGGCMMILVRRGALDGLLKRLRKLFYQGRGLSFEVHVCLPTAGAGLVRL